MDILASLPKIAGDFSFVLIFIAAALAVGFFLGRVKLLAVMIDVYIARALVSVIPGDWIALVSYSDTIIFLLAFLFLVLIDTRLFDLHISSRSSRFFWRVGVMGVLITGMVTSSLFHYLPKELVLDYVSVTLYSYFVSDIAQMFWMIAPLVVLMFINRRSRD